MPTLDITASAATEAVRKPQCDVTFGSGGAGAGLSPGSEDPWQRNTLSVVTRAALAPHADLAVVTLSGDGQAPDVAVEDEGDIHLGYEDDDVYLVFTAAVEKIARSIRGTTRIEAVNGGALLASLRINQSYEQQSAGDIVSDLASQAGVDIDTVESGADLPFYVIDDRRSAWDHIALLAQKTGCCAYLTTENALYFGPFSIGQAVQTFTYGVDIAALQAVETLPVPGGLTIVGEGAAGSQGEEAWSWLVKDPSSVTAEAGDGRRVVPMPALRSSEAVQAAAEGLWAEARRKAVTGRILAGGAPSVVVGSTIELAGLPEERLNGMCLVTRVIHEFSKPGGFISRIDFCRPADSNSGGLP